MSPIPRLRRDLGVFAGVALLTWASLVWAVPARAQDEQQEDEQQVDTEPSAEAWYSASAPSGILDPTCGSPLGCALASTPLADYPAGTLHVGVTSGTEEARSLLQLDLSGMPADARLTGGELLVPIGPPADGTSQPASARVTACLVRGDVDAAAGEPLEESPDVDCVTSADAVVHTQGGSLTVDLSAFAAAWTTSRTASLALVPAEVALEESDTWHVAFRGSDRDAASTHAPTATLTYTVAGHDPSASEPATSSGPPPATSGGSSGATPLAGRPAPAPPQPAIAPAVTTDPVAIPTVAALAGEAVAALEDVAGATEAATDVAGGGRGTGAQAGAGASVEALAIVPLLAGLLGVVAVRSLLSPMPAGALDAPDTDPDPEDEDF